MTLIKWKPNNMIMNDFDYMIDRIFNDGWNYKTTNDSFSPSVDIIEKDDEFILKADFPGFDKKNIELNICLLYTSPSPRDKHRSRMPSSA